eukprot:ANDGO_01371.mRNA.1 Putative glutaminase 3
MVKHSSSQAALDALRQTRRATAPVTSADEALYNRISAVSPNGKVTVRSVIQVLEKLGIRVLSDERLAPIFAPLLTSDDPVLELADLVSLERKSLLVERALHGLLVIPDWSAFTADIADIANRVAGNKSGDVARYIPQLARVNPEQFGVSVCSVDGQRFSVGQSNVPFCVQSCSKVITYCMALEEHGEETVHKHIGREPSGRNFNELVLNKDKLPHNPYINSGAIMAVSLIHPSLPWHERIDRTFKTWSDLAGHTPISFDNATYLSESSTADRNFTLGYMMKEAGKFPEGSVLEEVLNFYFMMCSIENTGEQMATIAATLANGGVCPITGQRVFQETTVRNALSLMSSCGMYDYSGEFAFSVGFPSKSGVAGSLMVCIPGVGGFCTWSPRLDKLGNSVRGIDFCRELSARYNFHTFDSIDDGSNGATSKNKQLTSVGGKSIKKDPRHKSQKDSRVDEVSQMLYAASVGDTMRLLQLFARGASLESADYDGRTALHLAASEGHIEAVQYVLTKVSNISPLDRFGNTPLDDAHRHGHLEVAALIQESVKDGARQIPKFKAEEERFLFAIDLGGNGTVSRREFRHVFEVCGLALANHPQIAACFNKTFGDSAMNGSILDDSHLDLPVTEQDFRKLLSPSNGNAAAVIHKVLTGTLVVPDFASLEKDLRRIYGRVQSVNHAAENAKNAAYIPQLASVDPDVFGAAVCTVDGQRCFMGDAHVPFTMQHCANVLTYCAALESKGEDVVHEKVGREPSGLVGDHLTLNHKNRPHNPFTNAGALACGSFLYEKEPLADRYDHMMQLARQSTGFRDENKSTSGHIGFSLSVFVAEYNHSDRNKCLLYHMREKGVFEGTANLDEFLQLYLMMCSLEMDCASMSVFAATLASGGICPITGERVFQNSTVRAALSLMASCGMYDFSGEWAFAIGVPAVAGASGALMLVIPGVMGIALLSPPLNSSKISARGVAFSRMLTDSYAFHAFDAAAATASGTSVKKDPRIWRLVPSLADVSLLCAAAAQDDVPEVRRLLARRINVNAGDYDGRTALHVAASAGHEATVLVLLNYGADPLVRDRWGATPLDDSRNNGFEVCVAAMESSLVHSSDAKKRIGV